MCSDEGSYAVVGFSICLAFWAWSSAGVSSARVPASSSARVGLHFLGSNGVFLLPARARPNSTSSN